ncbi:MAG: hypothetical protein Q8O89_08665 [Nanoarchaeota archaeon]|nr:hypothetical protein [Nanoarchaeota archaeon]
MKEYETMKTEIKSIEELVAEVGKEDIVLLVHKMSTLSRQGKYDMPPCYDYEKPKAFGTWAEFAHEIELKLQNEKKDYFLIDELEIGRKERIIKKIAPTKVFYVNGCVYAAGGTDYLESIPYLDKILEKKAEFKVLTYPKWVCEVSCLQERGGRFFPGGELAKKEEETSLVYSRPNSMFVPVMYVGIKELEK